MASNILTFPVQHSCPTCNRPCSPEDLSECLTCGQQYCKHDSWQCACDRVAIEVVQRARPARVSFLRSLLTLLVGGEA